MMGDHWSFPEFGIEVLRVHPRNLLDPDDIAAVAAFKAWRGDGMGGRFLPFSGGVAEQPAALMSAFRHMEAVAADLQPKKSRE